MSPSDRLARALAAIDAANADDPVELVVRGTPRPKELAHAELASEWIRRLRPQASEALQLAARAHHLRRWTIPRTDYPTGRAGYLRWRRSLQAFHAGELQRLLASLDYDVATIERACGLVQKKGLGRDPEVQALEDTLCLIFFETQLEELAGRSDPEALCGIVRKTLERMSLEGIEQARRLPLAARARALLERAAAR